MKKSVKNEDEDDHRRGRGKKLDEEEDKEDERTRRRGGGGGGGNKASNSNANTITSTKTTTNNTFSEQFPFHKACFENDRETVKDFLVTAERLKTSSSARAKIGTFVEKKKKNKKKNTILVTQLFDSRGNTALHLAIMRKNTDIVRILTEHPLVDVSVRSFTARMETIGQGDTREGQTDGDLHPNHEEKESEGKFGYEHAEIDATIDGCAGLYRKVEVGVEFSNIWTDFEKSRAGVITALTKIGTRYE